MPATRPTAHRVHAKQTPSWCFVALLALFALTTAAVPLMVSAAWADSATPEFLMIVHPGNKAGHVSADFVAQVFLKRTTRWPDGSVIKPVDLRPNARVRGLFSSELLRRSVAAVRSYWQQRIFSGRDLPPPELESDDAVVSYVLATPGAIGYVAPTTKLREAQVLVVR